MTTTAAAVFMQLDELRRLTQVMVEGNADDEVGPESALLEEQASRLEYVLSQLPCLPVHEMQQVAARLLELKQHWDGLAERTRLELTELQVELLRLGHVQTTLRAYSKSGSSSLPVEGIEG